MTLFFIATVFVSFPPAPRFFHPKSKTVRIWSVLTKKVVKFPWGEKCCLKKKERQFIPSNLAEVGLEISPLKQYWDLFFITVKELLHQKQNKKYIVWILKQFATWNPWQQKAPPQYTLGSDSINSGKSKIDKSFSIVCVKESNLIFPGRIIAVPCARMISEFQIRNKIGASVSPMGMVSKLLSYP